jgi:hypothetical protein
MATRRRPIPAERIGGPLPVHHTEAMFVWYPTTGAGRVWVAQWQNTGRDDDVDTRVFEQGYGPFDDSRPLVYASHLWCHLIARQLDYPELRGAFPPPSRPAGVG